LFFLLVIPFFKVLAAVHCHIDKEMNHMLGLEPVFLLIVSGSFDHVNISFVKATKIQSTVVSK